MIRRIIQLILDKRSARKAEDEVKDVGKRTEKSLKKNFKRVAAAIVAAFSVRAIVNFTKEMFRLGSSATETASKFRTVFGDERAAELDKFLDTFERLSGLTRSAGREMLANFGAVLQGAGIAADASAVLSEQMVRLAGDLQSFHDVPIEEAFAAIRSGATGEAEPLKRFGIVLRAVDVDARALANTGKENTKQLTEQERVLARVQLITEKAGVAVGDLARTQDSAANRARQLRGRFDRMRETVALGLLPALERLIPIFESLAARAETFANKTAGAVQALLDLAGIADQEVAVELQSITNQLRGMEEAQQRAFLTSRLQLAAREYAQLRRRITDAKQAIFDATPEFERVGQTVEDMTSRAIRGMEDEAKRAGEVMNFISRQLAEVGAAAGTNVPTGPDGDQTGRDPAEVEAEAERARERRRALRLKNHRAALREFQLQEEEAEAEAERARQRRRDLRIKNHRAALRELRDAEDELFHGLVSQTELTAAFMRDGFKGVGAAIVKDLIAGRAEEQFASGLAALASGTWPPNPAALAAAGKHFAAAAAFRALGAALGGIGGGGGVGGGATVGALGTSRPGTERVPPPEVNIFLDPLSPADPRFQRVIQGARQNAEERFGSVRVNVRPRTEGV